MELIGSVLDLMLVVIGFGLLIFVHELGHFLAAKWAGIRVLGFALGFGGAVASYRRGMGVRLGSSTEPEYAALLARQRAEGTAASPTLARGVSPTEYRLNWLPLGGYVKMYGQVDGDPSQVGDEPDSYQRAAVWKRMVVICAGVAANIVTACVLFMIVFKVGLSTEPATVGFVSPDLPASRAVLVGGGDAGGSAGLRPGDRIVRVGEKRPSSFNDVAMAVAMTPRQSTLRMVVDRPGVGELEFEVRPEPGAQSRFMEIGIAPPHSARLERVRSESQRAMFAAEMARAGAPGVEPGMRLVEAQGVERVDGSSAMSAAAAASGGAAFRVVFEDDQGRRVPAMLTPRALLEVGLVSMGESRTAPVSHVLGLTPVLSVAPADDPTVDRQGLRDGDIFARLGSVEYPSIAEGIREIRRHRGRAIEVTVLRAGPDGTRELVRLDPPPMVRRTGEGQIGFTPEDTREAGTWVSLPPDLVRVERGEVTALPATAAARVVTAPGSSIVAVDGRSVRNFTDLREALREATAEAHGAGRGARVVLSIAPPASTEPRAHGGVQEVEWSLTGEEVSRVHGLGWASPIGEWLFAPEQVMLRATGPIDAVRMGMGETHRVMVMTYLTLARLVDGTVKVEHLKGPVGIAHMGTRIVDRGVVWLLFFMALISVNLAVINFLPIPVVDGGQFLFLCIEGLRGKPPPIVVQNVATLIGMALIGTMFLIVTYHDIVRLFG